LKNTAARRKSLEVELHVSESTIWRAERDGIEHLTDLVLERASALHSEQSDVFASFSEEPSPLLPTDGEDFDSFQEEEAEPRWRVAVIDVLQTSPILSIIVLILIGLIIRNGFDSIPSVKNDWVDDALKERYAHLDAKNPEDAWNYNIRTSTPASKNMMGGWGPERPTFKAKKPAPYPVLNSITDFPGYGDQRNFVTCRATDEAPYRTEVQAYDGQMYQCMLHFGNAVAPNLDHGNPAAELHGARARILLPDGKSTNASLVGYLSAVNSITVWSSCRFTADRKVTLAYERDTAKLDLHTLIDSPQFTEKYDGDTMTSGIASPKGVPLGEEKLDGILGQESGEVTFNVRVELD
jgi:hypothetical protein